MGAAASDMLISVLARLPSRGVAVPLIRSSGATIVSLAYFYGEKIPPTRVSRYQEHARHASEKKLSLLPLRDSFPVRIQAAKDG